MKRHDSEVSFADRIKTVPAVLLLGMGGAACSAEEPPEHPIHVVTSKDCGTVTINKEDHGLLGASMRSIDAAHASISLNDISGTGGKFATYTLAQEAVKKIREEQDNPIPDNGDSVEVCIEETVDSEGERGASVTKAFYIDVDQPNH